MNLGAAVVFCRTRNWARRSELASDITIVGKKDKLCSAAAEFADLLDLPYLSEMADAMNAGYAGAKAETRWLNGATLLKVTLVALPEAASRVVTGVRPDAISKQLHKKIAGQEVVLAVDEKDVIPAGFAVGRCFSSVNLKVGPSESSVCRVSFHGCTPNEETLKILERVTSGIRFAQTLVDMPPNLLHPTSFKEYALHAIKDIPGVTHTSIDGADLEAKGYGLLHAVGKCAESPPSLLVLTHEGTNKDVKGVAFVGKGITFDTGGAAIKSRDGMCGMKRDMGGAAGVLGAFLALARSGGLPTGQSLHCVLCLAENSVGSKMFLQDDIITSYSGLSVEINNTDAEGRLVLSDGVTHAAKNLDCELIVDMATLTGAQGVSTGSNHALILATDEGLEQEVIAAGKKSGDMVHPGIFAPEILMHEFDSDFADMKNSVKNRSNAQSSCAGLFIHRHLSHSGYTGRWLHVDMASPVEAPLNGFATGWGVGLLYELLRGSSKL